MPLFLFSSGLLRDTYYERISHAESTVAVTHAVGGPSLREALQLVELVGNEAAVAAADLNDVLEAGRACAALGPNGWFTKNMRGDKLIGLTVFYDTPNPSVTGYYEALYRVHWLGASSAWGKYEHDDDDGGGGNDRDQLDIIELTIAPC